MERHNSFSDSATAESFTAVLLAGGKSRRMGRDKATLMIEGEPLWQRQLATLRALGPEVLLISGPVDGPFREAGVQIVPDAVPDQGPMGALATLAEVVTTERVVVLAVDLPLVTASFLHELLRVDAKRAVVPYDGERYHPLCAVYTKEALRMAAEALGRGERALQPWVAEMGSQQLAKSHSGSAKREPFWNLNTPKDLHKFAYRQSSDRSCAS